jgi:hypothetical protein
MRSAFLSAAYCRNAYLKCAESLYTKIKNRSGAKPSPDLRADTAECARHLAGVLISGYGLWSTGELQVRVENPEWFREFGEQVSDGDLILAEGLLARYEDLFKQTATVLPDQPDRDRIDRWVRDVRARALRDPSTLEDAVYPK